MSSRFLIQSEDLSNHTPVHAPGVELFPDGFEFGEMLPGEYSSSQQHEVGSKHIKRREGVGAAECGEGTYGRVQILDRLRKHFTCVLGPVRPAWELLNQCTREVMVLSQEEIPKIGSHVSRSEFPLT